MRLSQAIFSLAIIIVLAQSSSSQDSLVKCLGVGDIYFYSYSGHFSGGYYPSGEILTTVLRDTVIGARTFRVLSDGTAEYADSSVLLSHRNGATRVICDFNWSLGETYLDTLEGLSWTVYAKGVDSIFAEYHEVIRLTYLNRVRTVFKKYGVVSDVNYGLSFSSAVRLKGAKIAGQSFGVLPAVVTVVDGARTDASISVFPNPTAGAFTVQVNDSKHGNYEVAVFNILGQRIRDTYIGRIVPGSEIYSRHDLNFDPSRVPAGVYFVRVSVNGNASTKRIMLVR